MSNSFFSNFCIRSIPNYITLILFFTGFSTTSGQLDLDFDNDRGYYDTPFNLQLTVNDVTATIRYTTNGTAPTPTSGTIYSSPINISTTAYIRAIAYNSLDTTKVLTHTYIFPNDVINQPNNIAAFPSTNYGFDASVVNHPTYGSQLYDALTGVPSLSLVMKLSDFNNVHDGSVEVPTSVEILLPDDGKGYQANGGLERAGGSSFNSTKRNFRISFKSIYGDSKFDYPLFGKDAAEDFDQIALRPGYHGCMHLGLNTTRGGANDLADQVMRDLQADMSDDGVSLSGSFMHLYINGIYWGVYNPSERGTNSFGESYYDGDKDDWDAIKRKLVLDGNITAWNTLNSMVTNLDMANQQNYENIKEYIEVEQFADYVILGDFGPHADDHPNGKNSFVTRDRQNSEGFRFWIWDTEPAFGHRWVWTGDDFGSNPYNEIFLPLLDNSDFKMLVADRVNCHCTDNGALTPALAMAAFDEVFDSSKVAFIAEAARWATDAEYTGFLDKRDDVVNDYLTDRNDFVIDMYRNNGAYPNLNSVVFNQLGGMVPSGFNVTLSNPNFSGTIYYTLDGTDPRNSGGGISASAISYSGPISLSQGVYQITARIKNASTWTATCPKTFYVDQNYSDLVINEIHYNPIDSINATDTINERNFEFIEIKNIGNDPINVRDLKFSKGVTAIFKEDLIIPPDGFIVIAEDAFWFEEKYGCPADATYRGKLDNGGENLWLVDPFDNIIDTLRYNDKAPWPATADKGYYSLALLDGTLDNADGNNWSIQSILVTPKAENDFSDFGEHDFSGVVINEIHYNPFDSIDTVTGDTIKGTKFEFIELKNITGLSIDLSGAFFSRGIDYVFPDNTSIQANSFIVLAEDKSSFQDRYGFAAFDKYDGKLSNGGEVLWLNNAAGALMDIVDYDNSFPWDSQADGGSFDQSLALIDGTVDNDSRLNWKVQCSDFYTPGAENNFSCYSAPSYDGIIINELYYNPIGGSSVEFIEIVNTHPTNLYNLLDVAVTGGIQFVFSKEFNLPPAVATPQNYIVLAKDSAAFHNAYGFAPYGEYTGELSNSGEQIVIQDLFTNEIDQVTYSSFIPWDPVPSNGQYSLALIDQYRDNSRPVNWSEQNVFYTPGQPNTFNSNVYPDYSSIVINEIYYKPPGGNAEEFIEIVNTSPNNLVNLMDLSFSHGITYHFKQSKVLVPAAGYPSNYLILANDAASYQTANPGATSAHDSYDGFLVNSGELVKLVDFFGRTVDSIYYDDVAPWDVIADQGQHSLGLTDLSLDNAVATSWSSQDVSATPGLINTFADSDGDGVYDFYDICPGGDDVVDSDGDGVPDYCDNCNNYITETDLPTIMNSKKAQITIESNGTVPMNGLITYQAGQSVELMPEFEVVGGATFTAMIAPCQ